MVNGILRLIVFSHFVVGVLHDRLQLSLFLVGSKKFFLELNDSVEQPDVTFGIILAFVRVLLNLYAFLRRRLEE